ncbi:MAG: hypothetical protein HZA20_05335 [Nitrospirae bacterium]|nr:hypothetical protein [Nitrospirota bacterium]
MLETMAEERGSVDIHACGDYVNRIRLAIEPKRGEIMSKLARITGSNWETIAFLLINKILIAQNPFFSRSKLMSCENMTLAIRFSNLLGHKKAPDHPEETLQRTIQNLRDKGYIDFLGRGEYKLTESGFIRMANEIEASQKCFQPTSD